MSAATKIEMRVNVEGIERSGESKNSSHQKPGRPGFEDGSAGAAWESDVSRGLFSAHESPARHHNEFLARRFPESRRKAYYLMSIHEHLPPQARRELKEVGWTKGLELAKVARRDGQEFDCATWLHKARSMPKDQFKQEVERELTGRESEPWEIIYFKLYKTQIPIVEQAIETAALMLGTDKSRGYCLEMICADFLAGANLENEDPTVLLQSMSQFFKFLPGDRRQAFLHEVTEKAL